MSMQDRTTGRAGPPKSDSAGFRRRRHTPVETYAHYRRVHEELSEVDGLRAQVELLTRQNKELEADVKRLQSRQLLAQYEKDVLEKEVQVGRDCCRVAEAKYELLEAEVAAADSARELSESKREFERRKPF